mmetsp:Transcript_164621/g.316134  ORF Transcript_164621/g.316134 Transcript_164621/m.316134 type:complete len:219 (+) Transcript_164621:681-1337(+)
MPEGARFTYVAPLLLNSFCVPPRRADLAFVHAAGFWREASKRAGNAIIVIGTRWHPSTRAICVLEALADVIILTAVWRAKVQRAWRDLPNCGIAKCIGIQNYSVVDDSVRHSSLYGSQLHKISIHVIPCLSGHDAKTMRLQRGKHEPVGLAHLPDKQRRWLAKLRESGSARVFIVAAEDPGFCDGAEELHELCSQGRELRGFHHSHVVHRGYAMISWI